MESSDSLIKDLLERYKEHFIDISIEGPFKEGERADEIYKWQLITECQGKSTLAILEAIKDKNVVDVQHVNPVLSEYIKYTPDGLVAAFETLTDEKKALIERLASFKQAMAELCGDKYKVKANDERTAAAFLACVNPAKYTFYKDEIYQKYCNYIGEKSKPAGEKYRHYLELLQPLLEAIKKDKELTDKYEKETKGLTQSDILIAQNILWQMKDMMKCKQYWLYAPGKNAMYWDEYYNKGIMGIGWDEIGDLKNFSNKTAIKTALSSAYGEKEGEKAYMNNGKCLWDFANEVEIGDIIIVKGGTSKILGYGIVVSDYYHDNDEKREDFQNLRNVEWKINGEWEHPGNAAQKTLTNITQSSDYVDNLMALFYENGNLAENKKILSLKKNIILQGAPGTGKTYNTAALALAICNVKDVDLNDHEAVMERYEKLRKEGQIGFCTFHQSMDYEDFVEGIKPIMDEDTISYKVEDGIFSILSKRAKENYEDSKKSIEILKKQRAFEDNLYNFLDEAVAQNKVFETKTKSKFIISKYDADEVVFYNERNPLKKTITVKLKTIIEILNSDLILDQVSEIKTFFNRKNGQQMDSYIFTICKILRNDYNSTNIEVKKVDAQNYVLIIDEINRGNVSKIFGELITLLEADKRIGGEHPIKVTLPYSKEEFGVPSNLYIIGTMNTTDRSVGNIDYAVRRRFAFVTLESKREIVAEKCGEDSKAVQLFDVVKEFLQSHKSDMDFEDLMVGHSYFMAKDENELSIKWRYEILPLLNEYIKDGIVNYNGLIAWNTAIEDFINQWQSDTTLKAQADTPNQD